MVSLHAITRETFEQAVALKVAPDQASFVASNVMSIAFASFYREFLSTDGIFDDETQVGFTMYTHAPYEGRWIIIRYMIGEAFQRKGYGRAGLEALIAYFRQQSGCEGVYLSVVPTNTAAKRLYEAVGFKPTGKCDDDGEEEYFFAFA